MNIIHIHIQSIFYLERHKFCLTFRLRKRKLEIICFALYLEGVPRDKGLKKALREKTVRYWENHFDDIDNDDDNDDSDDDDDGDGTVESDDD